MLAAMFGEENIVEKLYYYKAKVIKVYDGDTITVDVDLGFKIVLRKIKLRLLGINCPEIKSKDPKERKKAIEARDFVKGLILGKEVIIHTTRTGKYGRWLAYVYLLDGTCLNKLLLKKKLARKYK